MKSTVTRDKIDEIQSKVRECLALLGEAKKVARTLDGAIVSPADSQLAGRTVENMSVAMGRLSAVAEHLTMIDSNLLPEVVEP